MESKKIIEIDLFKNFDKYIAKSNIKKENIKNINQISEITTIIILDTSGSMSDSIEKITHFFLPEFFTKLNYKEDQKITIITFNYRNSSKVETYNFSEIKKGISLNAYGGTYMCGALENLKKFLEGINKNKNIRILSISDGDLHDQQETINFSNEIVNIIKLKELQVNSQAIRFFTSMNEPDTRGLSSCLQFSNVTTPKLIDIQADNYNFQNYDELFKIDGFDFKITILSNQNCLLKEPWEEMKNEIDLFNGNNVFWISNDYVEKLINGNEKLKIKDNNDIDIKINIKEEISINNYKDIISSKIEFYLKKLKVLKILNSQKSLEEMDNIIHYFTDFENKLFMKQNINILDNSLNSRLILISKQIEKRKISISNKMGEIRNDEKITQLNSKQQAEYLRQVDINDKTSKALAKRAFNQGLDYDEIAKKEVLEMSNHIDELKDIDSSKLNISFYSTCNTLDGIKTICSLPKDEILFKEITINDIIKLINIVGIAAYSEYGNYPDPMTYRLEKIYPSSFISISDILTAYEVSGGKNLNEISNINNKISTCIPIYEDEKIHKFLIKYAPHILEYYSSVGMRKIIAEVPFTYEYSILAGYWKMIEVLLNDRSEVNINIFINFINNYKIASKGHFDYVLDLIDKQKKEEKTISSIYIANNGITNMTSPLIDLVLNVKNDIDKEFIQKIIRATYQFEVYQYIRKLIRKQPSDKTNEFIKNSLIELLGIDIEKNKTKLNPLFESDENLPIYDNYIPNINKSKEYINKIFWLDYITVVPILIESAFDKINPVEKIKNLPEKLITEDFVKKSLGIEYDLDLFRFNCIVQCFLYKEKVDRCDSIEKKMKISDLFYDKHFDKIIKKYVKKIFQEEFQKDKNMKIKEEINTLKVELVNLLLESKTIEDFLNLLRNGIKKGQCELKIINRDSIGYNDLILSLLNEKLDNINLKKEKLFIILTGRNEKGEILWNNGNFVRNLTQIKQASNILTKEQFENFNKQKKTLGIHIYRGGKDKCNRQGHSNDLPSYWAYGYKTIEEMANEISSNEMEEYKAHHISCCGFSLGNKMSYRQKRKKDKSEGSVGGASYHSNH